MGYQIGTITSRTAKKSILDMGMPLFQGEIELPNGTYRTLIKVVVDVTDVDYLCYKVHVSGANDVILRCKLDTTTVFTDTLGNSDVHYAQKDISSYTGEKTLLVEAYCNGAVQSSEHWLIWCQVA